MRNASSSSLRRPAQRRGFQTLCPGAHNGRRHGGACLSARRQLSGLATGLPDLDSAMGGLQPSDLIILAGRPGMGKTALATNIALQRRQRLGGEVRADGHTATVNGGIVGFFSLEMSAEQLATRIIAEQTGIPSNKIRRGAIDRRRTSRRSRFHIELQEPATFSSTRRAAFPLATCGTRATG